MLHYCKVFCELMEKWLFLCSTASAVADLSERAGEIQRCITQCSMHLSSAGDGASVRARLDALRQRVSDRLTRAQLQSNLFR